MWELPVIVVSMHCLGSINHTLLTLNALKTNNISIKGVVFVGDENSSNESCVQSHFPNLKFHRINRVVDVNSEFIKNEVERCKLNESWYI
jgi:dethiobiotin synthetase